MWILLLKDWIQNTVSGIGFQGVKQNMLMASTIGYVYSLLLMISYEILCTYNVTDEIYPRKGKCETDKHCSNRHVKTSIIDVTCMIVLFAVEFICFMLIYITARGSNDKLINMNFVNQCLF